MKTPPPSQRPHNHHHHHHHDLLQNQDFNSIIITFKILTPAPSQRPHNQHHPRYCHFLKDMINDQLSISPRWLYSKLLLIKVPCEDKMIECNVVIIVVLYLMWRSDLTNLKVFRAEKANYQIIGRRGVRRGKSQLWNYGFWGSGPLAMVKINRRYAKSIIIKVCSVGGAWSGQRIIKTIYNFITTSNLSKHFRGQ